MGMSRKIIWLLGLLLVVAAFSPMVKAQGETPVTLGPWRALEDAGEITVTLQLPSEYAVEELETEPGGPHLLARGPPTEDQIWRDEGQPMRVYFKSYPNDSQLPLPDLLSLRIQELRETLTEDLMIEVEENESTEINGCEAQYAFIVLKDMGAEPTYGRPLTARELNIIIRVDNYHPDLPGSDLYLLFGATYIMVADLTTGAEQKEDLHSMFDSLQLEIGAAGGAPAEEGLPIVWIIVPVICVVVAILALLYFRLRWRTK